MSRLRQEDASGGEQECWFGERDAMNEVSWKEGVGEIAVSVG